MLRSFTLEDADDVTDLVSDYEVAKTTLAVPHPYPTDGAAGWIAGHSAEEDRNHTTFAITLKTTGELVGAITLIEKRIHLRAEIGYWIGHADREKATQRKPRKPSLSGDLPSVGSTVSLPTTSQRTWRVAA